MDEKDKALSEKEEAPHLPNDHGALGERTYENQDEPDMSGIKRADKTSEMEGINEVNSAGSHGAFEGFENTEEKEFSENALRENADKKSDNDK